MRTKTRVLVLFLALVVPSMPAQALDMLSYLAPCLTDGCSAAHRVFDGRVASQWKEPFTNRLFTQILDTSWTHWLRFTWDESWIYLDLDQVAGLADPSGNRPYHWANSRWMQRTMTVGDSFTVTTTITNWHTGCATTSAPYTYTMTLQSFTPAQAWGGDAGNRDTIALDYAYSSGGINYIERNYYALGWGWISLDVYANGVTTNSYTFNFNGTTPTGTPVHLCPYNGTTTIGVYRPSTSTFYLRNSNSSGAPDITVTFGAAGDLPVAGDWTGQGFKTIGIYRPSTSTFYLRNSNTAGPPDITITGYGTAGDIPVVGDWDGNGTTTIGVYRQSNSTFYLRNSNTYGSPDIIVQLGTSEDLPFAGDWDGNYSTTVGLYRPSAATFYLWNHNTYGAPDVTIASWGSAGDIMVAGDWDGDGVVTIGVYRPSTNTFYLRNSNSYGAADIAVPFGASGDIPIVGNWDGQ